MKEQKKKKCGRKRLVSVWGEKTSVSFSVYPPEKDKLKSYYQKLKQLRSSYCFPVPEEELSAQNKEME